MPVAHANALEYTRESSQAWHNAFVTNVLDKARKPAQMHSNLPGRTQGYLMLGAHKHAFGMGLPWGVLLAFL